MSGAYEMARMNGVRRAVRWGGVRPARPAPPGRETPIAMAYPVTAWPMTGKQEPPVVGTCVIP